MTQKEFNFIARIIANRKKGIEAPTAYTKKRKLNIIDLHFLIV